MDIYILFLSRKKGHGNVIRKYYLCLKKKREAGVPGWLRQ